MKDKLHPVNLALIGKGKWGQNYINTITGLSQCTLPLENIRTRDYPVLFDLPDIDGVIVATPTNTHFGIAQDLLRHGLTRLLIEKPITQTLEEAVKLQQMADELNANILVGHIQLYDPAYQELKRHLKQIGIIQKLTYKGLQSLTRTDATVLQDWGPHPIYLFMDLVKGEIKTVSAQSTSGDNLHLEFNFLDNILGVVDLGWTAPGRKRELTVIGDHGSLTLDGSTNPRQLYRVDAEGKRNEIDFPATSSALTQEVLAFINYIRDGKEPRSPLIEGIKVMEILNAAENSLNHSGENIKL